MKQQRKPQERAFHGLVGRDTTPLAPPPRVIDGGVVQFLSNEVTPPNKKMGRPPKGVVAMTPAERKQRQRDKEEVERGKAEVDAMLAALIRQQGVDHRTGGYGRGMFLTHADQGKGLLETGGYNSAKLDVIVAHQDGLLTREQLRSKPSGAGSESIPRNGSIYFDVKKYPAAFTHSWNARQAEELLERVLKVLMVQKTVCLVCGDVIGASSGLATTEEIDEHLRTHPPQEDATANELRCAVCGAAGTNHIRDSEFNPDDKAHNKNCKEELYQLAGTQPRKMSANDKAHRSAVRKIRQVLQAPVRAIEKAVKDGPGLMEGAKYREYLNPTTTLPRFELAELRQPTRKRTK